MQMALAVALLWSDRLLQRSAARVCDMAGPSPAFTLLISVNAPVILPRTVWFYYLDLDYAWDIAVLIAAVGFLWY